MTVFLRALSVALIFVMLVVCTSCTKKMGESKVVAIGVNLELTGAVASMGQSTKNGFELAMDEQNAKGGLLGKQVQLMMLDNKSDATESTNQATKLITQQGVVAMLGPITSGNCKAAGPVAQDEGIVLLTPTATNPDVTEIGDCIFRACYLDSFQGKAIAGFAYKQLKAKTMAIVVENGNDYAKGLGDFTSQAFKKLGGKVVAQEYYAKGEKDFSSILTKIKPSKPDIIVAPSYYETVGLCIKQAREMGFTMPIMGADGWDSPKLVEIAGVKNLNNTYFTNHYTSLDNDPKVQTFVKAYKAKYHKTPDAFVALGYDSAMLMFDAIQRANAMDAERIRTALSATKNFSGVTGAITMGKDRNPIKSISVLEMKDGQQTLKMKIAPDEL